MLLVIARLEVLIANKYFDGKRHSFKSAIEKRSRKEKSSKTPIFAVHVSGKQTPPLPRYLPLSHPTFLERERESERERVVGRLVLYV